MIMIATHADGSLLAIRAQPAARKNGVVGEHAGALKLAVTAPADRGRANKALVQLLCDLLDLRRSQVRLLSGETSQDKRFLILGMKPEELQQRLKAILP